LFVGTAAIVGFALTPLSPLARMLYGALAVMILLPPETFGAAGYLNIAGIIASAAAMLVSRARLRAREPGPYQA
jgi:hypothetical protein